MLKKALLLCGFLSAASVFAYQETYIRAFPSGEAMASLNTGGTTRCQEAGRSIRLVGSLGPYHIGADTYHFAYPGTGYLVLADFSGPEHRGTGGGFDTKRRIVEAIPVEVYEITESVNDVTGKRTLISKVLLNSAVDFPETKTDSEKECIDGE